MPTTEKIPHGRDAHCEDAQTLDDDDNCTSCGATSDGGECGQCGGTRYHEPGCPASGGRINPEPLMGVGAPPRTEQSMEEFLENAILDAAGEDGLDATVRTFEEAHLATRDRGLVVRFGSTEFQITILRSAR